MKQKKEKVVFCEKHFRKRLILTRQVRVNTFLKDYLDGKLRGEIGEYLCVGSIITLLRTFFKSNRSMLWYLAKKIFADKIDDWKFSVEWFYKKRIRRMTDEEIEQEILEM